MSNLQLFISLAGFLAAIFAWFRFDINKCFDEHRATAYFYMQAKNLP